MVRKKIDARIKGLIEQSVNAHHRSLFVLIGDRGKDQIVHLHYMLSKAQVTARPSILWCYKKELGFSSNKKKRMKLLDKKRKKGISLNDVSNEDNLFDRFLSTTEIRYCYYKETEKILGNTYGMCVLQDFEAMTPNLLARTIETVKGGGIIIILLNHVDSLRQLYTMTMDVHSRYRTEITKDEDIVGRFTERFLLSLSRCHGALFIDDSLNVLPISSFSRQLLLSADEGFEKNTSTLQEQEVSKIKQLADSLPETYIKPITKLCKTEDQAKAVISIAESFSSTTLKNTISLTASRGRGKSAALGLSIAIAVVYGFSNIFVTSPSPSNLGTLFAFLFKGLDVLGFKEHMHYDVIQSTSAELSGHVVRVNVFKSHRQTVQYIAPEDSRVLGQAELVVIDEAAAIPLPLVKSLIGPYLVLLSSTIHGYEGTGRSLSLKLLHQLKAQPNALKELRLEAPIRYAPGDPVEEWLNLLLCFNAVNPSGNRNASLTCPHPNDCQLFYVNRDTLFSFHDASEAFLQKMMYLYISSHYKNTPNDLQLMSDAPAHHLFVLLGPAADANEDLVPEILCVVQVAIEGLLTREVIMKSISRGQRGGGDLIPWTISMQFQDSQFGSLSGARIVRIAVHPELQKMGYGTRTFQLLEQYYNGDFVPTDFIEPKYSSNTCSTFIDSSLDRPLEPRTNLPPLLSRLYERPPEKLDWIGVSYGLTQQLIKFWKRVGLVPLYLRQTKNELTGEHTVIMLKQVSSPLGTPENWLSLFFKDFYCRFYNLLAISFRDMSVSLALELMYSHKHDNQLLSSPPSCPLSKFDLRRVEAYLSNITDFHVILDLVPVISRFYFLSSNEKDNLDLSPVQRGILLAIGAQGKSIDDLERLLHLSSSQLLAIFAKVLKKFFIHFRSEQEEEIKESLHLSTSSRAKTRDWEPLPVSMEEDLTIAANTASAAFKVKQQELIESLDVNKYAISVEDGKWNESLTSGSLSQTAIISVKNEGNLNTGLFKSLQDRQVKHRDRRISKALSSRSKHTKK